MSTQVVNTVYTTVEKVMEQFDKEEVREAIYSSPSFRRRMSTRQISRSCGKSLRPRSTLNPR